MAEYWVRLWSGTTTDPKWQTIARKSGQPRSLVMAFFMHLLMVANDAEDRGSIGGLSVEDAASAMDCDEEQIAAILEAMQGRVIEGGRLSGWEKRQPSRNDEGDEKTGAMSAAERKRKQREREKSLQNQCEVTSCHDESREVTSCHAPEADTDTEADKSVNTAHAISDSTTVTPAGQICARLRREARMPDANPMHPKLLALLDAGLSADEIIAAGHDAAAKGKGFPYALAVAEGRRREAAAVAPLPDAPARRSTVAEEREAVSIALTGRKPSHERQIARTERDITGESFRVA